MAGISKMIIRKMLLLDIDEVTELEKQVFSSPWPRSYFEYEITQNPLATCLVGEIDQQIMAVGCMWCLYERAEITSISVAKKYQRQGYGKAMLLEMLSIARMKQVTDAFLEVRVSNLSAKALYESMGFSILKIRKQYYEDNQEDAYEMHLHWEE